MNETVAHSETADSLAPPLSRTEVLNGMVTALLRTGRDRLCMSRKELASVSYFVSYYVGLLALASTN